MRSFFADEQIFIRRYTGKICHILNKNKFQILNNLFTFHKMYGIMEIPSNYKLENGNISSKR